MRIERTPFTIYDLIGYFIPGFLFLYLLYLTFDVDIDSILCLEHKDICTAHEATHAKGICQEPKNTHANKDISGKAYEYIIFSVFLFIGAWFVGHLLSYASHWCLQKFPFCSLEKKFPVLQKWGAEKIFKNSREGTAFISREGKGKTFSNYAKLIKKLFKKIEDDKNDKNDKEIYKHIKKDKKDIFLKTISSYLDPEKQQILYNYLVIQGCFRAFTLCFILHFFILFLGFMIKIIFDCNFGFEKDIIPYIYWMMIPDFIIAALCWNIYLKYYRRHIEENIVFLIHELYLKKEENK